MENFGWDPLKNYHLQIENEDNIKTDLWESDVGLAGRGYWLTVVFNTEFWY
jgi:hypothetical protein